MEDSGQSDDRTPLYLDDLHVGQRFTSGTYQIDEAQIVAFARQFDPQPFHLDAQTAAPTFFKGLVASGWHTAAVSMRLFVEGGRPLAGGLIGAGAEIRWPNPTRPGAVLHVVSEVLEVKPSRSHRDRGLVTIRNTTIDQHGTVVQSAVCQMVVPRRSPQPE